MKTLFHFHLIMITTVLLSVDSCKNKKDSAAAPAPEQPTATTPAVTTQPVATATTTPKAATTIRFIASFYSPGGGIDLKINEEFVKFLDSYPKKIAYTPTRWGREGEVDYCIGLTELSVTEQTEFVKKAFVILAKSKQVHTKENSSCERTEWTDLHVQAAPIEDTYRLVVSFYSEASGIDLAAHKDFEKFLSSYPKKIAYEPTRWGREGEVDYCLKLSELSTSEQAEFVKKATELLSKSKIVHVNENSKCVHKH